VRDDTLPITGGLLVVSQLLLGLGPPALVAVVLLWLLALPLLLPALRTGARAELAGAAFLFLTAAYADTLDEVFGREQTTSVAVLLLGAAYLVARRRLARQVCRSPLALAFALFLLQQCASALLFGHESPLGVASNRGSIAVAFVAGAVLTRAPGGRALMPSLVVLGALMSLPVMLRELADPASMQVAPLADHDAARAGGLYQQANNAGVALCFALAFTCALSLAQALRARTAAALVAALLLGIVCTASRGALLVAFAMLVGFGIARALLQPRRRTRVVAAVGGLAAALLLLRPLGRLLEAASERFQDTVDLSRLAQLTLSLSGAPDATIDNDTRRLDLARYAWAQIGERPLFGHGTGLFMADDQRSHLQFLEILGENGILGALFYAGVLLALGFALARLPLRLRLGALLVAGAWLLTHFDNHNLVEFRFMVLPLAYLCGLDGPPAKEPPCEPST
jgi:O-antigen ligase